MAHRILHLVGSAASERMAELSRLYARDCLRTIEDPDRYEPVIAHVDPDRRWRFPTGLGDEELAAAPALGVAQAVRRIVELEVDAMVPQMFCRPGMTEYRGLFDLLGIPYLGNRPDIMADTLDKARAKAIVAAAGVPVAAGEIVGVGERPRSIAPPAVVKPVDGDNSDGVTLVLDAADFPESIARACKHGSAALVETFVPLGREVRCGVLERGGELVALPLEEYAVDAAEHPIRDGADKLGRGEDGALALMAKTAARAWIVPGDDPIVPGVQAVARRCHRALSARHYSLVDLRIDPGGRPVFLEAGLYCSFARQSVLSVMAAAAGITTDVLFAETLSAALESATT